MALIIRCRSCRRRVPPGSGSCPDCGSVDWRFVIDYWPRGRSGGRKRLTLPDEVTTESQAWELERAFVSANVAKKNGKQIAPKKTKVEDLFEDYLGWYHIHRKPSTWHDVSGAWNNSLQGVFGALDVAEIGVEHYSMYQALRSITVSNRTANKELDYFNGFLRWCRREKKLQIDRILYEELPCNRPLPIILSFDEVDRFMAASQHPVYHALFQLLYATGVRKTSATTLLDADFDFENKLVRILAKGGVWKLLPITDVVIEAVKKAIAWREEKVKTGKGWAATRHVFSVRKNGEPLKNFRKEIARCCQRAGIKKRMHAHLLRHTVATHMLAAEIPLRTIQDFLGHSQSSTTEIYTHIDISHLRAAQQKVDLYKKDQ